MRSLAIWHRSSPWRHSSSLDSEPRLTRPDIAERSESLVRARLMVPPRPGLLCASFAPSLAASLNPTHCPSTAHSPRIMHGPASSPLLAPLPMRSGPSSKPFFVPSVNEHTFHAHSAIGIASKVTLQSAGVGLLVSAVQNALQT